MEEWIRILVAFVDDDPNYDFGTRSIRQVKVATPERKVEVQEDERWDQLLDLSNVFARNRDISSR